MAVALIIIVLVFFHLAWYALSYRKTHLPLPDEAEIGRFQKAHADLIDIESARAALEEDYIEANGFRLHLDIFSRGKGHLAIVFIPGTSVYAQNYIDYLAAMHEAGFNVVGFDPRGHGRSSGKRGDYTINTIVEDTLAVVDYTRKRFAGKVAVAGSSQGGIAAFYVAARDGRLAAAVCHNLADLNGRENQILSRLRVPWWMAPLAQRFLHLYRNFVIPIFFYLDLSDEHMKNGMGAAQYVHKDPLCVTWITLKALNSLLKTPLDTSIEEIKVPIMVVHPEYDSIFPRQYIESIYERLTCQKKFYLVKKRKHLVMINDVEEITPPIAAWLREITGASQ